MPTPYDITVKPQWVSNMEERGEITSTNFSGNWSNSGWNTLPIATTCDCLQLTSVSADGTLPTNPIAGLIFWDCSGSEASNIAGTLTQLNAVFQETFNSDAAPYTEINGPDTTQLTAGRMGPNVVWYANPNTTPTILLLRFTNLGGPSNEYLGFGIIFNRENGDNCPQNYNYWIFDPRMKIGRPH